MIVKNDKTIHEIYKTLLKEYGPQGWWPLIGYKGTNPTKTGSIKGYHPDDYSYPKNKNQKWEIICGTLLTQNTSWPQVEKALLNLKKLKSLSPNGIIELDIDKLKEAIKPAGYFNQKSQRLKILAEWFINLKQIPTREELLKIKGVGPETADSILLYAFKQPSFVIDAYTKRIMTSLKLINENAKYDDIKQLFEDNLEQDVIIYQEFHALIVEHAKRYYTKKPYEDKLLNK